MKKEHVIMELRDGKRAKEFQRVDEKRRHGNSGKHSQMHQQWDSNVKDFSQSWWQEVF